MARLRSKAGQALEAAVTSLSGQNTALLQVLNDVVNAHGPGAFLGSVKRVSAEVDGGRMVLRLYRPLAGPGGLVLTTYHSTQTNQKPWSAVYELESYYDGARRLAASGGRDGVTLLQAVGELIQARRELAEATS